MKSRFVSLVCLTGLCLLGVADLFGQADSGQPPADPLRALNEEPAGLPPTGGFTNRFRNAGQLESGRDPRLALMRQIDEAKSKLKDTAGDKRAALAEEISSLLNQYFEADMNVRRAELKRLTARTDSTEALLEKRKDAREKLIDLEMQVITHDAEGLGLFGSQAELDPSFKPVELRLFNNQSALGSMLAQQGASRQVTATEFEANQLESARQVALEKIASVRRTLKASGDADGKATADKKTESGPRDELKAALGEYFDADMTIRRNELAKIRSGLEVMQQRLQKREEMKTDIISLQLRVIVTEADGMGFFSGDASRKGRRSDSAFDPYGTPGSLPKGESSRSRR